MGGAFVPLPANDGHCHEIESLSFITIQRGLKLMLSNSFGCEQTQTDLLGNSVTNGASGKKYRQRGSKKGIEKSFHHYSFYSTFDNFILYKVSKKEVWTGNPQKTESILEQNLFFWKF
ncbi:hypothetical protein CDAR_180171 [Caerostris darwini]|uniref:Uncharacterized protein n=1 Tax=Caerostris darwini TaxID=1538125 RepID=A0AAV4PI16_9ARAC|nr:hypothetical protein CDAR_180171 [Caerostris darwini]